MKKIVLKLELHDEKGKQKAMTTASGLSGVESVAMDMKDKKLTITGDIDPVRVVGKLRKICQTEILTVGPAKQEDNKKKEDGGGGDGDGAKKDNKQQSKDQKKPGGDEKNKGGGGAAGGGDQNAAVKPFLPPPQYYYQNYPPPNFQNQPYNNYRYPSEDQDSNSCVIS